MVAIDQRFWVMFWDALRLLARGDADKPFTIYLELLAFTLPTLLRALPAEDATHQALFNVAYRGEDTRLTGVSLRQLMDAYVQARTAIVALTRCSRPASRFRRRNPPADSEAFLKRFPNLIEKRVEMVQICARQQIGQQRFRLRQSGKILF